MPRLGPPPPFWTRIEPALADGTVARRADGVSVYLRPIEGHRPYGVRTGDGVELTEARRLTAGGSHCYSSVASAMRSADVYLPLHPVRRRA